MTALEWFNLQSYRADKTAWENEQRKQWQKTH